MTDASPNHAENPACPSCGYALTGLRESRCPECGRAFDPAGDLRDLRKRVAVARAVIGFVMIADILWGGMWALHGRSLDFGPSLRVLSAEMLIMMTVGFLPVAFVVIAVSLAYARSRRPILRAKLCAAIILAAPIVTAEAYYGAQDLSFHLRHRDRPAAAGIVHERRWWPRRGDTILYDPVRKRWWATC